MWASLWAISASAAATAGFLGFGEVKDAERQPSGSVDMVVVSLADQAFAAYANGGRVMRGPISSGMAGFTTDTGNFRVTNKHEHWVSTIYDVPMPHFLRLNGGSMGLHGGYLPGFAASHGCVRLMFEDAEKLFGMVRVGVRVVITAESTQDTKGVKQPPHRPIYYRVVKGKKVIVPDSEVRRRQQIKGKDYTWHSTKNR